jgi:acyl carrier protein
MRAINLKDVERIFSETFPDVIFNVPISDIKSGDIEDWDSLGNFNLLLAFEEFYGIRFTMEEMTNIRSIQSIVEVLKTK